MCDNVFKNTDEKRRKEVFTQLFAQIVSNRVKVQPMPVSVVVPGKTGNSRQ